MSNAPRRTGRTVHTTTIRAGVALLGWLGWYMVLLGPFLLAVYFST